MPPYGTGSNPPLEKGLHLKILFIERIVPLKEPYFSIACIAYTEQVGV